MKLHACSIDAPIAGFGRSFVPRSLVQICAVFRLVALLFSVLVCQAGLQAQSNYATPYTFTTLAGTASGNSTDGTGNDARLYHPFGSAVDSAGNVYVADSFNHMIRKITAEGVVTTLAGRSGTIGSSDGTGTDARFYAPHSVAVDSTGNVYVADTYNHTIRKITAEGVVTTLAGSAGMSGSTDGTGSAARFGGPHGVAVDSAGNVYVTDDFNNTIRKITAAGVVTTIAGLAGTSGSTDGTGTAARFSDPNGIAVDSSGTLYVADCGNNTIRKITAAGVVTTLAGTAGTSGSTNATGAAARFNWPDGVAVDSSGYVYVADYSNHMIRKITSGGVVTTLAGKARTSGSVDGTGTAARFNFPSGVAVDSSRNVYVADSTNNTIRKVTAAGVVTTLAGMANTTGSADGKGAAARFNRPDGVAVDSFGSAYVADMRNHTIRKITSTGVVSTLAGTAGASGSTDGEGTDALFSSPKGVAIDSAGILYVASGNTIRMITPSGTVTTLAGTAGTSGSTDGTGAAALFNSPVGVAVDGSNNVYVADSGNNTIRMVTPSGVVSTLAGTAGTSGSTDGTGTAALFDSPHGVAVDDSGNVYVADSNNHTIRKITPMGDVSTLAGTAGKNGWTDGTGSAARFEYPSAVAIDSVGNVFVTDFYNCTIRKITSAGVVTTLAGNAGSGGAADGTGSDARFYYPSGVAVERTTGAVYIADTYNHTIRVGLPFPARTYAWFLETYFSAAQQSDESVSGPGANPSGDGMTNFLKYALGLDPMFANAAAGAPVSVVANGHLMLTFPTWTDVADLRYDVEVSDDLVTWNSGSQNVAIVAVTPIGTNRVQVTVQDLASVSEVAKRFIRLRVTTR